MPLSEEFGEFFGVSHVDFEFSACFFGVQFFSVRGFRSESGARLIFWGRGSVWLEITSEKGRDHLRKRGGGVNFCCLFSNRF